MLYPSFSRFRIFFFGLIFLISSSLAYADRTYFLLLLGAPGAGKGTQGVLLQKKLNVPHISTGDLLRAEVKNRSPLGLAAHPFMLAGTIFPEPSSTMDLMLDAMKRRFLQEDCKNGFILEGISRTVWQAGALEELLTSIQKTLDAVISLEVDERSLLDRLAGRRVCKVCRLSYHVTQVPPRVKDQCDQCSGPLSIREDDQPEVIRTRLKMYSEEMRGIHSFYSQRKLLKIVLSEGTPEETQQRILKELAIQ